MHFPNSGWPKLNLTKSNVNADKVISSCGTKRQDNRPLPPLLHLYTHISYIFWSRKCKKFARSLWNRFKSPETSPYRYVHVQMSKFYHIQRRFSPETKRFSKRCLPLYQKGLAIEYLQTNKKFIHKVKNVSLKQNGFGKKFAI